MSALNPATLTLEQVASTIRAAAPRAISGVFTDRNNLIVEALGSENAADVADLVGGYVLDDPQAVTALQQMVARSGFSMGNEAHRERFVQAALRFAELVYQHADVQWGDSLVEKDRERIADLPADRPCRCPDGVCFC